MMALTLHRPWAWAIVHATKRVENRTWRPPTSIIGQRIAIHAGKKWDEDGWLFIADYFGFTLTPEVRDEGIVGTARVTGYLTGSVFDPDPWLFGPIGWVLDDVRALPMPIPVRGRQGLWRVPPPIARQLVHHGMCAAMCAEVGR